MKNFEKTHKIFRNNKKIFLELGNFFSKKETFQHFLQIPNSNSNKC